MCDDQRIFFSTKIKYELTSMIVISMNYISLQSLDSIGMFTGKIIGDNTYE